MATPREVDRAPARHAGRNAVLALTLLFVLAALAASTGLVAYTAWNHDFKDGLFALAFAVLSAHATMSWCVWQKGVPQAGQPDYGDRKPANEVTR
jgi:hypothetical protein